MAVVEVWRTEWRGWAPDQGAGALTVFANDQNGRVDRVEVDNAACALYARVRVLDEGRRGQADELLFDQTYAPHQALAVLPVARNLTWRQDRVAGSTFSVNVSNWLP